MSNETKKERKLYGTRVLPEVFLKSDKHWSEAIADKVLEVFPNEEVYGCAAGISPSGMVHFGNFRDVMTAYAVLEALKKRGKKTKFIFSWDDFDRFRKVPEGVPAFFEQYLGLPLSAVPDPSDKYESYARSFEVPFEESIKELCIELDFKYQTKLYRSGIYTDLVIKALQKREEIADMLLSFMTDKAKEEKQLNEEKYKKNFYPISVYSKQTGKDNTKVLSYNGGSLITYKCLDTGIEETVDIKIDPIVKLAWKVDWPMRWLFESVVFEPGGKDHASPGSSYDVSSALIERVYGRAPVVFAGYEFIGIQGLGAKMSGSKGNAVTPKDLLEIYTPELLKWLYLKRSPHQAFTLAFDSEIYRQYEEFDKEVKSYNEGILGDVAKEALILAFGGESKIKEIKFPIPMRQAVAFGQIMQWDEKKMSEFLASVGFVYDINSVSSRLPRAKAWLLNYNESEMIKLRETPNTNYASKMSDEAKSFVKAFREKILSGPTPEELEVAMYVIPKDSKLTDKENSPRQRAFFKDVYNLLIDAETGPRLSTFIRAIGEEKASKLLNI